MNAKPLGPYLWMLCGCFAFAWMGEFTGQLGRLDCDWRIIALARAMLAFVFAVSLARLCGAKLVFAQPPVLWLRSIAGSVSLLCTFFALTQIRVSEVLTLTNTFPIWVAVLSWPLLRVRPALSVWIAAGCGVVGVALMQQPTLEDATLGQQLAVPLALFAAFTSAIAMLGLNRLKGLHPWAIVAHFSGVATAFVLAVWVVGWIVGPGVPLEQFSRLDIELLLIGVGVSATIGQLCLTQAFTTGEPAKVSVLGLTQIVFALCLDLLLHDKPFALLTLAGMALVMAPTAWVMAGRAAE